MTSHTWLWRWYIIAKQRVSASEARLRIAPYSLCIMYVYIHIMCPHLMRAGATVVQAWHCYSCASLMVAPCAEWYIALQPSSTLFSGSLYILWWFFRRRSAASRSAFTVAGSLSPPLCCALLQCAVASVRIVRRFTLGALHLYKC